MQHVLWLRETLSFSDLKKRNNNRNHNNLDFIEDKS